jgi:hypothetical protein
MPKIKLLALIRVLKHFCTGIYTLESDFCFTAFMVLITIEGFQNFTCEIGSVI